jgi:hypothetical protein
MSIGVLKETKTSLQGNIMGCANLNDGKAFGPFEILSKHEHNNVHSI